MNYRELILKNFWWKGFSLVLATLIWFALGSDSPTESMNPFRTKKELEVSRAVAVLKSPADQRVYRVDPAQVTVKVEGDSTLLGQLNPEDLQVYVNVGALNDPNGSLKVEVHVPSPGIAVLGIAPAHVNVRPLTANP